MSLDYIVIGQANLFKSKPCNADLALYADFVSKSHHINSKNNVVLGMKAYHKKYSYKPATNGSIINTSGSMLAESTSSSMSMSGLADRSQSSSTRTAGQSLQQQSVAASSHPGPQLANPKNKTSGETTKDPLLVERRTFRNHIHSFIAKVPSV